MNEDDYMVETCSLRFVRGMITSLVRSTWRCAYDGSRIGRSVALAQAEDPITPVRDTSGKVVLAFEHLVVVCYAFSLAGTMWLSFVSGGSSSGNRSSAITSR